jgi:CheY-like chemotaxis protein
LIFLDVQMPKRDGFSLLPELRPAPDIIFATAFDTFAVKAFEVNAADFLLKPISADRLALALSRLDRRTPRKAKSFAHDDRVFLYSDLEVRVVSEGLGIIARFLFIIAVVVIAHGGWQIRSGNADQGKMSIVGGLLLGLAVVIAEALFNAGGMPTISISR